MKTMTHVVAQEDVMALMEGELTAAEAAMVMQHVEQCAECALLMEQLRDTSQSLAKWTVPAVPAALEQAIEACMAACGRESKKIRGGGGPGFRSWRFWAIGGGGAVFAALLLVFSLLANQTMKEKRVMGYLQADALTAPPSQAASEGLIAGADKRAYVSSFKQARAMAGPLIARTASLTLLVKNLSAARDSLDGILARHHGYIANLQIFEERPPRGLTASVRVPVSELTVVMAEMRALGKVEKEGQSGEEVTQQHEDLVARLTNERETEVRLRDILAHQAGRMQDVLAVEEKISETRAEIEQLEAEQQNLEHRVEFASVDLEIAEQYEAQLSGGSASIPNKMHNAFIDGLGHARDSLLGMVLFFVEYGPVTLLWLAIPGVSGVLVWRRYRKIKNAMGR